MKTFKQFITEYEETAGRSVVPSHVNVDDIDHDEFHPPKKLGNVDDHEIIHYKNKNSHGSHFTFAVDNNGNTNVHIEHKKPTVGGRLAISNMTKIGGSAGLGGKVVEKLISSGHKVESDNTNSEGAHKMWMKLAKNPALKAHIEDGKGNVVPHEGDITSDENQKKFVIKKDNPNFLNNNIHKHVLVLSSK